MEYTIKYDNQIYYSIVNHGQQEYIRGFGAEANGPLA